MSSRRLLTSSAIGAVLALLPLPPIDIFIYASLHGAPAWAQTTAMTPGGYPAKVLPDWIKASCCGPTDVHHLRPDQVHRDGDFYHVDGYQSPIPAKRAEPSQDGDYWIFYRNDPGGGFQSAVYCFFIPMEF